MYGQLPIYVSLKERERERKRWLRESEIRRALGDDAAPSAGPLRWIAAASGLLARLVRDRSSHPASAVVLGRQPELGSRVVA